MKHKSRSDIIKEKLGIKKKIGFCTWCKEPVQPPKQTWCSKKCVEEYKLATDWNLIRNLVFKRDKGICAVCGVCTKKPDKTARQLQHKCNYSFEVDHVIPFSTCFSHNLENLRTLCKECHKQVTKKQAQERQIKNKKKVKKDAPVSRRKKK